MASANYDIEQTLTEEQIRDYRAVFSLYRCRQSLRWYHRIQRALGECHERSRTDPEGADKQDNDAILCKELGHAMRDLGLNPTEHELADMTNEAAVLGDGTIKLEEFLSMMAQKMTNTMDTEEEMELLFRIYDTNHNGYIDIDEFEFLMKSLGDKLTKEEVKEMFIEADMNKDGQLSYEEFRRMITSLKNEDPIDSGRVQQQPAETHQVEGIGKQEATKNGDGDQQVTTKNGNQQVATKNGNQQEATKIVKQRVANYIATKNDNGNQLAATKNGSDNSSTNCVAL